LQRHKKYTQHCSYHAVFPRRLYVDRHTFIWLFTQVLSWLETRTYLILHIFQTQLHSKKSRREIWQIWANGGKLCGLPLPGNCLQITQ